MEKKKIYSIGLIMIAIGLIIGGVIYSFFLQPSKEGFVEQKELKDSKRQELEKELHNLGEQIVKDFPRDQWLDENQDSANFYNSLKSIQEDYSLDISKFNDETVKCALETTAVIIKVSKKNNQEVFSYEIELNCEAK